MTDGVKCELKLKPSAYGQAETVKTRGRRNFSSIAQSYAIDRNLISRLLRPPARRRGRS